MHFFQTIIDETPKFWQFLLVVGVTALLSLVFGLIYCKVKEHDGYYKDIPITLVLFPVVSCAMTVAVSALCYVFTGTTAEARYGRIAIALFASFVMIKFRSQQRTTEDLTYLFFVTGFGLLMGLGYIWPALSLYLIIVLMVVLLYAFGYPMMSKRNLNLKVTIPEDLNYENVFDDIFNKYTTYAKLTKVRTSDMGTMFVLNYEIILKKGMSHKELLDDIRSRNGNLNVILTVKKFTTLDN